MMERVLPLALAPILLPLAQALLLFAPLLVASALSALVIRLHLLRFAKRPIDGGVTFGGTRLFGDSKTWRGVIVAVLGCVIAVLVQRQALPAGPDGLAIVVVDYDALTLLEAIGFGAAMGLGAMLGELPNSFVKRRLGIAPGRTTRGPLAALFYVWDQVDLLTGAWPLIAFWVRPTPALVIASFALALVLHPTVSLIGWALGARKTAR